MSVVIRKLEELYKQKSKIYGNKANNLSCMLAWGIPVLPGFCITFDAEQEYAPQIDDSVELIEEMFYTLIKSSKSHSAIVRSSADLEDIDESLFPGVFRSVPSVTDLPGLFSAIRTCFGSLRSTSVAQYIVCKEIKQNIKHFTVIVQQELIADYSGIASTQFPVDGYHRSGLMLTELTQGANRRLIKGLTNSNTYTFHKENNVFSFRKIVGRIELSEPFENVLMEQLHQLLVELQQHFHHPLEIEWGYADGIIYVFQARSFPIITSDYQKDQNISAFIENKEDGLKYQAMQFFVECGLFPREVSFFPARTPKEKIVESLRIHPHNTPLTVRYSRDREIGLPRCFADSVDAAIQFILHTKDTDWSVIVYKSISVVDSYELYLDSQKIVLEHVPGMWESDSFLLADTVLIEKDSIKLWLVDGPRTAKLETSSGITATEIPPIMLRNIMPWLADRLPTLEKLKEHFSDDLPINLHFVSDGKQDFFLNSRIISHVDWLQQDEEDLYTIREISDFSGWDGVSSILFCPKLCRGEELFLTEFVPFLKAADVPVFVEFGILSHPAIMLREFGITVIPKFMCHRLFEVPYSSVFERSVSKNEYDICKSISHKDHL